MSIPVTRDDFKEYCLRELGKPVIEINVDEDQVQDRIDDALIFFQQFSYDATERTYLKHELTSTDISNEYVTIPDNVIGVIRMFPLSGSNLVRNMFDIRYQMRLQDIQSLLSASFTYYYITQTHLALIDELLVGMAPIRFHRHMSRLFIDWEWAQAVPGDYIILEVASIIDPDAFPKIWGDRLLKKYACALIKKQWGNNLSKYNGIQMPGGVILNGQQIKEEAVQEIEEIEEEIKSEMQEPPSFFVG